MDWDAYADEITKFEENIKEAVRLNFKRSGYVVPIALLLGTTNQDGKPTRSTLVPIMLDMSSDTAKEYSVRELHRYIASYHAVAFALCIETWMLTVSAEGRDIANLPRPSESPDRTECVMVVFENLLGATTWMAEITRSGKGQPTLGAWSILGGVIGGRFSRFIEPVTGEGN